MVLRAGTYVERHRAVIRDDSYPVWVCLCVGGHGSKSDALACARAKLRRLKRTKRNRSS